MARALVAHADKALSSSIQPTSEEEEDPSNYPFKFGFGYTSRINESYQHLVNNLIDPLSPTFSDSTSPPQQQFPSKITPCYLDNEASVSIVNDYS
jgi:hypothetical protein